METQFTNPLQLHQAQCGDPHYITQQTPENGGCSRYYNTQHHLDLVRLRCRAQALIPCACATPIGGIGPAHHTSWTCTLAARLGPATNYAAITNCFVSSAFSFVITPLPSLPVSPCRIYVSINTCRGSLCTVH